MKESRAISKRELSKADKCKMVAYFSVGFETVGSIAADISSIEGANLVAAPIAAAMHLGKGASDAANIAMDCSSIPFDEIKEILNKKFKEMDRKLDKNTEALEHVSDLVSKTLSTVEKIRIEMREGFNHVIETIENIATKEIVFDINKIVQYFNNERENINSRQKEEYVAKLQEPAPGNFLLYLRNSRTPESGTLYSLLFRIIEQELAIPNNAADNNAIQALYALFYGTETFISIMFYLVKQYAYLAEYHYQKGNLEDFNTNFDHMKIVFQDFKFSLTGNNQNMKPLVNEVINVLNTVKNKSFIRNVQNKLFYDIMKETDSLLQLKNEITGMDLPIIDETPSLSISIQFKERSNDNPIETPLLKWEQGTEVKYAIQFEQDGKFSKISSWSRPVTVQDLACPFISVDKDTRNRLVFRRFGDQIPELVGILRGSQVEFRDIHRDLYNAAQVPYMTTAHSISRVLIQNGANVSETFELGRGAIHAAASAGNYDVGGLLIDKNINLIEATDKNGYTPLHIAADSNKNDFVMFLIGNNADVNVRTKSDLLTPLHLAARRDLTDITQSLTDVTEIDLNAQDKSGFTPLHLSISGTSETAAILIKHTNVVINIKSKAGLTPLHLATLQNNLSISELLSGKGAQLNYGDINGMTPLHYAAMTGNLQMVDFLLNQQYIDINVQTKEKEWTPLHLALLFKKNDVAERLLRDGNLNVHLETKGGINPLHLASATGNKQLVIDLLQKNVDINRLTANGYSALHLGIIGKNEEIPFFLVEKEANVNDKTNTGMTPLHFAAALGKANIFRLLLDRGANIKAEDINFQMPIHEAVSNGHLEIVRILIEKDPNLMKERNIRNEYPFYLAVEKRYQNIFEYLVSQGANVNDVDGSGNTLLHLFSSTGELEIVQFLMKNGANFRLKNYDNKTFFDLAIENGRLNIVTYSIENNKVNLQASENGRTNLFHAVCDSIKYDKIEIVKYFIGKLNESECPLLHQAATYAHLDLVKYFVQEKGMNPSEFNSKTPQSAFCQAILGKRTDCEQSIKCDTPERLEVVEYLVDKIPDINETCDDAKNTPISMAVFSNKVSILNYLVRLGADPSQKINGDPLLYIAAMNGCYETVKCLIEEHKIDINTRNKEQFTALHAAAANDHLEVVKYLVRKGADVHAKGENGVKPIDIAQGSAETYLKTSRRRFFRRDNYHKSNEHVNFGNTVHDISVSANINSQLNPTQQITSKRIRSEFNSREGRMNSENVHIPHIDVNGALILLDFMIRVFTSQKINFAAHHSRINTRSTAETQAEALMITERFQNLLSALVGDRNSDSVDFSKVQSQIYKVIMSDRRSVISEMLCSYAEEYSKLDPKSIKQLLSEFETLTSTKASEIHIEENVTYAPFETCELKAHSNILQIK